jgi:hypothetical protein
VISELPLPVLLGVGFISVHRNDNNINLIGLSQDQYNNAGKILKIEIDTCRVLTKTVILLNEFHNGKANSNKRFASEKV